MSVYRNLDCSLDILAGYSFYPEFRSVLFHVLSLDIATINDLNVLSTAPLLLKMGRYGDASYQSINIDFNILKSNAIKE